MITNKNKIEQIIIATLNANSEDSAEELASIITYELEEAGILKKASVSESDSQFGDISRRDRDEEFKIAVEEVIEQHKELLEKLGDLEVSDNKTILEMEKINKIKRDELTTLIVSYEATIGLLKETLEFYANENHYFDADIRSDGYVVEESSIDKDYGKLARKALSKIKWSTSNKKNL